MECAAAEAFREPRKTRGDTMQCILYAAMLAFAGAAFVSSSYGQSTLRAADTARFRESLKTVPGLHIDLTKQPPSSAMPGIEKAAIPGASIPVDSPKFEKSMEDGPILSGATSVVSRLKPGEAMFVRLPAADEAKVRGILSTQVAAIQGTLKAPSHAPAPQVTLFESTVRTLSKSGDDLLLKPVAYAQGPLRFDGATRRFIGRVVVGLLALDEKAGVKALSTPITFEIVGDVQADPRTVDIKSSSPPFAHFNVAADDPRDRTEIKVYFSQLRGDPVALQLDVDRPRLKLSVAPPAFQGLGLEKATVTVSASDVEQSAGREVTLTPTGGALKDTTLTLGPRGSARTEWRSSSIGHFSISADGGEFSAAEAGADFEPPWRFGIAALIGGLAGGILRNAFKRRGARRFALEMVIAVVTGAVVFGLFVLGVNVTGFTLPASGGEILVFVVSAIGALLGTAVLTPKSIGNEP